ncbi:hypothetical protein TRFO_40058 [Tritrichomonas foetus]|uniref:TOG domain-containing protein n=1 Tax=Tritrichomonas foetus TaxID=1144522 RepID=A0A1J4J2L3_9EUKA|nr:hypothetical protein TRFO_40058 [Tritrichomonas foetus]|eukprot:OHS93680.1 hypothetical protein TRFO_40058 [Tritrichomonas foetus]
MKGRRSASVTRNVPSAADISEQTQKMFDNAGNDLKPIRIKSNNDAGKEIDFLEANISERVEWDDQVKAMQRGMALVNGGAVEYDSFVRGLNRIYSGLVAAATNLRSALVKQSCLFIAQLAREIGPPFDQVGDFITPLSSQLSHGTQIIAESCKLAILCISKYCFSRKILKSIFDICNARGPSVKAVAAESLSYVLLYWPHEIIVQNYSQVEHVLQKLISDAAVNTRAFARQAAKAYQTNYPQKANIFISKLDQRTQKSINDCILTHKPQAIMKHDTASRENDSNNFNGTYNYSNDRRRMKRDSLSRTSEKVDIAANPPRMIRPKKVDEDDSADVLPVKRQRNPSVQNYRRRASLNANVQSESSNAYEEPAISKNSYSRKRFSMNDNSIRRRQEFDLNDDENNPDDYGNEEELQAPQLKPRQTKRFDSQRHKSGTSKFEPNNAQTESNFTEIPVPSSKYRSKYMQNNSSNAEQQQQQATGNQFQMNNTRSRIPEESSYRSKYAGNYGDSNIRGPRDNDDDNVLSKVRYPRRQASVQPQRREDARRNILNNNDDDYPTATNTMTTTNRYSQKIVEKRKPIQLVAGDEKNYLAILQSFVDDDNISDLASSMTYISRDLLTCCSSTSPACSSQSLSILLALLPIYAPHFRSILPSLVETVLNQAEIGNPRSSNTAKQILSELHRSFDSNTLLLICTTQPPSVPLLNFTDSLVSLNDIDIVNDTICFKLLTLAFRCYNIGSISNRRTAARIIERVHDVNSQALKRFTDSLRDQQLRQFDEFIRPYLPDIQLRTTVTDIPRYNARNVKSWVQKIIHLVQSTEGADWIEIRPALYTELVEALKDKKEVEPILSVIHNIFTTINVEDFNVLLPGLLANIRGNSSKLVDSILTLVFNALDPVEVFASLQPVITGTDSDIARAAIGFQTLLISKVDKFDMRSIIPSLIPGLTKSFESNTPEVRKAVVLCFVELYARFDKDLMDRHTSHLSKGQLKLIGIYLNRRKE